MSNIDTPIILG